MDAVYRSPDVFICILFSLFVSISLVKRIMNSSCTVAIFYTTQVNCREFFKYYDKEILNSKKNDFIYESFVDLKVVVKLK